MNLYTGVVENRDDPFKLGRCQVRIMGLHTHIKAELSTEDLPWAYPMQPITSAAMSGIGHSPVGPVEGTWVIVMFRDNDKQYPIILGTVGGIPQTPTNVVIPEDISSVIDANTGKATQQASNNNNEVVNVAEEETVSVTEMALPPIPTVPPPSSSKNIQKASLGIQAILDACDELGLTTREQKCTVLALVGGESGWIPQSEGYIFSDPNRLITIFKATFATFPTKEEKLTEAKKWINWKGTKESWFHHMYAPENNGRLVGNTQPTDGESFYGRGLLQFTGRDNYTRYNTAKYPILTNQEILNTDIKASAYLAVLFVKDHTKNAIPTAHPGYFYTAKNSIGRFDSAGNALRIKYYEYFYGKAVPSTTTKTKSPTAIPQAPTIIPTTVQLDDKNSGFKDPNNKYPLALEPDTNRLARGIEDGTIVPVKNSQRVFSVRKGLSDETYDEPASAFSAQYPYNHVFESESGHIQEWDDTPGHERINTYHRTGTFTEIDANGTEVHHIVGDSYTIVDRNGCIYITGESNLTVDGNINILCKSNANIEVTGDADIQVGLDANIGVANDLDVVVGGSMTLDVKNALNIKAKTIGMEATSINLKGASVNTEASTINMLGSFAVSGGTTNIGGSLTMVAPGNLHSVGGGSGDGGVSLGWTTTSDPSAATASSIISVDLISPDKGTPLNEVVSYAVPPSIITSFYSEFETDEDWSTKEGIVAKNQLLSTYGAQNSDNVEYFESKTDLSKGLNVSKLASCVISDSQERYTADFKLSTNFTLGMLFNGGYNIKHKLQNQCELKKVEIVCNLIQLCENVLEQYLTVLPGGISGYQSLWDINSGYRQQVKGSLSKSDHLFGRAVDITLLPNDTTRKQRNYELIKTFETIVPYDQLILEYRAGGHSWIHTGYRGIKAGDTAGPGVNRKMAFTMLNDVQYKKDGKSGFYLL